MNLRSEKAIGSPVHFFQGFICYSFFCAGQFSIKCQSDPELLWFYLTLLLPCVTKTEFLLTISIQHQVDK